jgi:hypothetical protein
MRNFRSIMIISGIIIFILQLFMILFVGVDARSFGLTSKLMTDISQAVKIFGKEPNRLQSWDKIGYTSLSKPEILILDESNTRVDMASQNFFYVLWSKPHKDENITIVFRRDNIGRLFAINQKHEIARLNVRYIFG